MGLWKNWEVFPKSGNNLYKRRVKFNERYVLHIFFVVTKNTFPSFVALLLIMSI